MLHWPMSPSHMLTPAAITIFQSTPWCDALSQYRLVHATVLPNKSHWNHEQEDLRVYFYWMEWFKLIYNLIFFSFSFFYSFLCCFIFCLSVWKSFMWCKLLKHFPALVIEVALCQVGGDRMCPKIESRDWWKMMAFSMRYFFKGVTSLKTAKPTWLIRQMHRKEGSTKTKQIQVCLLESLNCQRMKKKTERKRKRSIYENFLYRCVKDATEIMLKLFFYLLGHMPPCLFTLWFWECL